MVESAEMYTSLWTYAKQFYSAAEWIWPAREPPTGEDLLGFVLWKLVEEEAAGGEVI